MTDSPMGDKFQILHLTNGNAGKYGPMAIERIKKFCASYDSDIGPDNFASFLMEQMTSDYPSTMVIVGVDDGDVAAHLIASVERFYGGEPVLIILQLEVDKEWDIDRKEMYESVFPVILRWADSLGCKKIRIWGRNKEVADKFIERFGFVDTGRYLLERPIGDFNSKA